MTSFISRLIKSSTSSKRLISQLTQRGEGKLTALLRQFNIRRLFGGKEIGQRSISTTPVMKKELTDDLELATGIFKREMMLRNAGCNDPWSMTRPIKRGAGRANDPTMIPSAFDGRLVGCLCHGDRAPKWMWLEKGDPKRCECGHFYLLKHVPAV